MSEKPKITIYCDGGANPNPGAGGWAVIFVYANGPTQLSGKERITTTNQMKLTAAINALNTLDKAYRVNLYMNSEYVQKIIDYGKIDYRHGGKNADLWRELIKAIERHEIRWYWIKRNSGYEYFDQVVNLVKSEIIKIHEAKPHTGEIAGLPTGVVIYTSSDVGSWYAIISGREGEKQIGGEEENAPSYKMALIAAVTSLESISTASTVEFYTNNEHLIKGVSRWITVWQANGWITYTGEPVKYKEIWTRLLSINQKHEIIWKSHESIIRSVSLKYILDTWWLLK